MYYYQSFHYSPVCFRLLYTIPHVPYGADGLYYLYLLSLLSINIFFFNLSAEMQVLKLLCDFEATWVHSKTEDACIRVLRNSQEAIGSAVEQDEDNTSRLTSTQCPPQIHTTRTRGNPELQQRAETGTGTGRREGLEFYWGRGGELLEVSLFSLLVYNTSL